MANPIFISRPLFHPQSALSSVALAKEEIRPPSPSLRRVNNPQIASLSTPPTISTSSTITPSPWSKKEKLRYRVNVFPIRLPALRERRDDILLLANHFADKYARRINKRIVRISTPAISAMLAYHYPNPPRVGELHRDPVLLSADGVIHSHNLPPTLEMPAQNGTDRAGPMQARVESLERAF